MHFLGIFIRTILQQSTAANLFLTFFLYFTMQSQHRVKNWNNSMLVILQTPSISMTLKGEGGQKISKGLAIATIFTPFEAKGQLYSIYH